MKKIKIKCPETPETDYIALENYTTMEGDANLLLTTYEETAEDTGGAHGFIIDRASAVKLINIMSVYFNLDGGKRW